MLASHSLENEKEISLFFRTKKTTKKKEEEEKKKEKGLLIVSFYCPLNRADDHIGAREEEAEEEEEGEEAETKRKKQKAEHRLLYPLSIMLVTWSVTN